jgi:integrase
MPVTVHIYDRLLRFKKSSGKNPKLSDFVFFNEYDERHRDKMMTVVAKLFKRIVKQSLIEEKTDKKLTLYSLRHMYATFALTYDRMSVYTLAEHMGTSVKMIEDHYGQLLLKDKAAEIAGDKEFFLAKAKREEARKKKHIS